MAEPEIASLLDELGFVHGCVVEAIVATKNPDGSPNAAPMGVVRNGPSSIEIRPFKTSLTYRNLIERTEALVLITDDPALYLVTAFKHEPIRGFDKPIIEEKLSLKRADGEISVKVVNWHDISEDRGVFTCNAHSVKIIRPLPRVFSRGRAMAIEAVIHATRVERQLSLKHWEEAERLIRLIGECEKVIERVSTRDSTEARVLEAIGALVEGWRERESRSL